MIRNVSQERNFEICRDMIVTYSLDIKRFDIFLGGTCWLNCFMKSLDILYFCETSLSSVLKLVLIGLSLISSKTTRFSVCALFHMSFQTVILPTFYCEISRRIWQIQCKPIICDYVNLEGDEIKWREGKISLQDFQFSEGI